MSVAKPPLSFDAQRVYNQLAPESIDTVYSAIHGPIIDGLAARKDDADLDTVLDASDWGFAFGIAFAIARARDPFASIDEVTVEAVLAAAPAFTRFSTVSGVEADVRIFGGSES